ncbi:Hypothetical predicted protein, partial [Olea europaea subsp. europaea]
KRNWTKSSVTRDAKTHSQAVMLIHYAAAWDDTVQCEAGLSATMSLRTTPLHSGITFFAWWFLPLHAAAFVGGFG